MRINFSRLGVARTSSSLRLSFKHSPPNCATHPLNSSAPPLSHKSLSTLRISPTQCTRSSSHNHTVHLRTQTQIMGSFSMVAATGCYHFKINHSKTKDMCIGDWITSPTFRVGQHDWAIYYYPQGDIEKDNDGKYLSVYVTLLRESVDVSATLELALLDKNGNVSPTTLRKSPPQTFTSREVSWGLAKFFERTKLEETYIKDCYVVLCVKISVQDESCTGARWNTSSIGFPRERLQQFRDENKHTDVSFDVAGEIVVAHKLILAAHSPVFEAELFGSMAESNKDCIIIGEMIPTVFKAMLNFMYNGSLSVNMEFYNCEEPMLSTAFLQHLLAAADRYAVEKLKAICEYELVESISLDTVLSTLELAEIHNCSELKKYCLRFIVEKNNSVSLMFNEDYIELMQNYPSLLGELKDLAGK